MHYSTCLELEIQTVLILAEALSACFSCKLFMFSDELQVRGWRAFLASDSGWATLKCYIQSEETFWSNWKIISLNMSVVWIYMCLTVENTQ